MTQATDKQAYSIRVIQPTVDIALDVPEQVGVGQAKLAIRNEDTLEGRQAAFTIRVKCTDPCWQENWAQIGSVPARAGDANSQPPRDKPDLHGPLKRWVTVHIPKGGEREIVVHLQVPRSPESRAGIYRLTVVVEALLTDTTLLRREQRFTEWPVTLTIRPFYDWSVDLTPVREQRVGRLRRRVHCEATVTNRGNDWLYCALQPSAQAEMRYEAPGPAIAAPLSLTGEAGAEKPPLQYLAVRPPEPTEESARRSAPLRIVSRHRLFHGDPIKNGIPVGFVRLDAPSVPRSLTAPQRNTDYEVKHWYVHRSGGDQKQTPPERTVTYYPPIPGSLTGGFRWVWDNARTLIFAAIGLMVAVTFGLILFENFFRKVKAEPITDHPDAKGKIVLAGQFLTGAKVSLMSEDGTKVLIDSLETRIPVEGKDVLHAAADRIHRLQGIPFAQREYREVTLDLNSAAYGRGRKVHFRVQRAHFIPFLGPLMPYDPCLTEVTVGVAPEAPRPTSTPKVTELKNPHYGPASVITLEGEALGAEWGQVLLLPNITPTLTGWSDGRITFTLPKTLPPGPYYVTVKVRDKDLQAGQITIDTVVGVNAPDPNAPGSAGTLPGGGTGMPPVGGGVAGRFTPGGSVPSPGVPGGRGGKLPSSFPPLLPGKPGQTPGSAGAPPRPTTPSFPSGEKPPLIGPGRRPGSFQGGDRPGPGHAPAGRGGDTSGRTQGLDSGLTAENATGSGAAAVATRAYLALDRAAGRVLQGLTPAALRRDPDFLAGEQLTDEALGLHPTGRAAVIAYTANGLRLGLRKIEIMPLPEREVSASLVHNRDWQLALDDALHADPGFLPAAYWRWGFERYIVNEQTQSQAYLEQALSGLPSGRRSSILTQWKADFQHRQ